MTEVSTKMTDLPRSCRQRRLAIETPEDLVQDVLLSVHAVRATFDPKRPFMPWLAAITRNRLVDATRSYMRVEAREVQIENMAVTFSDESAKFTKEQYGDPEALKLALESLPAGQRNAIEMLKLREMSLKEAADASGTSIGALKIATHRAMNALLHRKFERVVFQKSGIEKHHSHTDTHH